MSSIEANTTKKGPFTKEKLRSIMEAASALTALGDEDSVGSPVSSTEHPVTTKPGSEQKPPVKTDNLDEKDENGDSAKRYIPDHKKPDAALTFPEKLMNLMRFADEHEEDYCVSWLPDGKSFVIRNPEEFTRKVLTKFFKATKFSSFTRKLYRWGFRQVNRGIGPDDPIIFGNEHFQRDNAELMTKMRSITAASTRKAEQAAVVYGVKRPLDISLTDDRDQKRVLLDHLIQQKAASLMGSSPSLYNGLNPGGQVSLTNALNPNFGMGVNQNLHNALPGLVPKHMDMSQNGLRNNASLLMIMQSNANSNNRTFPSATSTAEIVNAAISALRYAN